MVGPATTVPDGGHSWSTVRGAFMLNGRLYTAWSDGSLTKQTFDGTTYGAAQAVDTADELSVLTEWRGDIASATGMFYDSGRIYFTRAGSSQLFYRYFTPESDVVGAKRLLASENVAGIDFAKVRGMFGTGTAVFWATPDGALHRMDWQHGRLAGAPVAGTESVLSGPSVDGTSWSAHSLFLFQDSDGENAPAPPTAAFSYSCDSARSCTFDGRPSTAPGSSVTGYAWDFGDGAGGSGATVSHRFADDGDFSVTLTVTAGSGTDADTQVVPVRRTNQPPVASFTVDCVQLACSFDAGASSDPDGTVTAWSWDFGDGTAQPGATTSHTYSAGGPRTVTLTVTDNEGATASTTRTASPAEAPVVQLVGAASTNGNRSRHVVTVPAAVQAGDTLVMFLTMNGTGTVTAPAGWTPLEAGDGSGFAARAWTRTATTADAGSSVAVTTPQLWKSDLSVAAYRSAAGTAVSDSNLVIRQTSATSHATPAVTVEDQGSWLVSYWGEKSSNPMTWTAPAGQQVRASRIGTGSGKVSALLTDSGAPVAPGQRGALTATTAPATARVAAFSVVVAPD
jgi:PKD repeat protein